MKYALCGLLAAFAAVAAYSAIPTSAEGWYTPDGGFAKQTKKGTVFYSDEYGETQHFDVTVDDSGNVTGGSEFGDPATQTAYLAMLAALKADAYNDLQDEAIETIGQNLDSLFHADGIQMEMEKQGPGGSSSKVMYTLRLKPGSGTGATITAEDPIPYGNIVDAKTVDWTQDNSAGQLQMHGANTATASTDEWWNDYGFFVPYLKGNNALGWKKYGGWYSGVFDTMQDGGRTMLTLAGWTGGHECSTDMKTIMTEQSDSNRGHHYVLTRFGTGSDAVFHYVPFGDRLEVGGGASVDESSITTNTASGATSQGLASLYGWSTANSAASAESPKIPTADGSGYLVWHGLLDLFNEGIFDLTSSGKVNLRGVSASEDNIRVMTVSAVDDSAVITSSNLSELYDSPLAADSESGKITINGWRTASPSADTTLADKLQNGTGYVNDPAQSLSILSRDTSGAVAYLPIGTLPAALDVDGASIVSNNNELAMFGYEEADEGTVAYKTENGLAWRVPDGVAVDDVSITTNVADGASSDGVASLRGFSTQDEWAIPYKNGDGANGSLAWRTPSQWCGDSLVWEEVGSAWKFNVVGATDYAGKHSKHYFGTSNDKTAALGWHELPNVTTNRVEGDEVTISSTVDEQDPGLKRLGLLGWNRTWSGDPLFVVNAGGAVGYIPLPAITNLAACACTNKWNNLLGWIDDGELNEDDGITFTDSKLDDYLYGTLGYIYSTTADNLHFDNDGEQIQASFTAPENWADGDSVELTEDGVYQINGWADASACAASVSAMLSEPSGSDATTHLLLAKKTDTGELHYVPIGDGVSGGAPVDGVTITTNTTHGAVTQGLMSLYGWSGAENDTYLSKNEGGSLEWRRVNPMPGVDDTTIATNTSNQLVIKGFATAANNSIPWKDENGDFVWGGASTVTNRILAGSGINITDNGGGAITISAQALGGGGSGSGTINQLTVVTDVRYDETTHKFQKKTQTLTFTGTLGTESGWTDVFTAVSHQSEHDQ